MSSLVGVWVASSRGSSLRLVLGVPHKYQWYCCSLVVRDSTRLTSGSSSLLLGARHYFLQEGFSLGVLSGGHFLAVMRWPLVAVASLTVELRL